MLKALMEGPFDPTNYEPELLGWYSIFMANGVQALHPQGLLDFNAARHTQIAGMLPFAAFSISGGNFSTSDNIATLSGPRADRHGIISNQRPQSPGDISVGYELASEGRSA